LACVLHAEDVAPPLRTVRAIRELSAAQADQALPAELSGVVLGLAEPEGVSFVLQDATDSLYMVGPPAFVSTLAPGDEVIVQGRTDAGGFAPILRIEEGRKTGARPVPAPRAISSDELFTQGLDAQWIAVTGIVRNVRLEEVPRGPGVQAHAAGPALGERMIMTLAVGERLVPVQLSDRVDPARYVDAEVEIQGLCFNQHNAARQFLNPLILIPRGVGLRVLRPPPAELFGGPAISASTLFQFAPGGLALHRVHVVGVALHQKPGVGLWLRDGDRGLFVESELRAPARPGDRIEVEGFPARGAFSPILIDSVYRTTDAGPEPAPVRLTDRSSAVRHDGDLVALSGVLLGERGSDAALVLRLDWLGAEVEVLIDPPAEEMAAPWRAPGALLSITGICLAASEHGTPLSGLAVPDKFRVLARRPADIALVRAAPWWTGRRLTGLLAVVVAALAAVLAAVFVASRRKLARERALRTLKASEYAARLAERSRMARDIHDSVAQGLGAISLQLQLAGRDCLAEPQAHHLALAQQLVRTSLAEVRGFIRDLRTQVQKDVDLAPALEEQLRHAVDGAAIRPVFTVAGELPKLSLPVETQVLRITQEAMTNAICHAQATTLSLQLRCTKSALILTVTDDGRGFDHAVDWAPHGHFGLLGMKERANLIGATLEIETSPGAGAQVRLTVPATASADEIHRT